MINSNYNNTDEKGNPVDPECPICHYRIKKWARTTCDACGAVVCRRHRPMFDFSNPAAPKYVSFWLCPSCRQGLGKNS